MPAYDIVVFENRFPSLQEPPPAPAIEGSAVTPVRPSHGVCEVVCYSDDHHATFATLPYSQVRKLTRVWKERFEQLSALPEVGYVFIFENKGKEIGVTLSHPHGQIYAYPFIPPTMRIELDSERKHFEKHGRPLMGDWLATELDGRKERVVWENDLFAAVVPFFARYPYEVHIAPKAHIRSLKQMEAEHLDQLAEILLAVTRKYDKLFGFSMPYIMNMHQEPAIAGYEFSWFHIEFYPPYRTATKLKYLAGSEAGAGAFINDTLPEVTAKTLRDIEIGSVK